MPAPRQLLLLAMTVGMTVVMNGCLINRVSEVRDQFCEFDSHFDIDFTPSPEITFLDPVLLDSDIQWLAGATPSRVVETEAGRSLSYEIEAVSPVVRGNPIYVFALDFTQTGDEHRLSGIRLDPAFGMLLNADTLDARSIQRMANEACDTGWSFATRELHFELTEEDLLALPGRGEIMQAFGPPAFRDREENSYTWKYRLVSAEPEPPTAQLTLWFDDEDGQLTRMLSSYSRYQSELDVAGRRISMKLQL